MQQIGNGAFCRGPNQANDLNIGKDFWEKLYEGIGQIINSWKMRKWISFNNITENGAPKTTTAIFV